MIFWIVLATVVVLVWFVVGLRLGASVAREEEHGARRQVYRIRASSGKCSACGNFKCPEPLPPGWKSK